MRCALREVLGAFRAFDVGFEAFGRFAADLPVLYLAPEPARPILDLVGAIAARFPEHPPSGGVHETVIRVSRRRVRAHFPIGPR